MDQPLPSLPGSRFGALSRLDAGAFAVVYEGVDAGGTRAAIKVLSPRWRDDAAVAWRFASEHRRLGRLDHPAFPRVREVGHAADGSPYYAMELLAGRPPVGPLPAAEVRRIVEQLADALAHMHGLGLVHGDVKPANVLLGSDGEVHLLDLGLAAPTGERRAEVAGSLEYLAPEVFRRQPVHPASDLYALGVLAYALWTGRTPFEGSPAELVRAHLQAEPTDLPGDDPALAGLVSRLLAKAAGDRPPSAAAVAARLRGEPDTHAGPVGLVAGSFVGREELLAGWSALLGSGGALELVAEAGGGKSRALDELRLLAEGAGWRFVGSAARGTGDAPGAPLRAVVGQAIAGHDASAPTRAWLAGQVASELADLEPGARQAATRVAIARDLVGAAGTGLAVGLDDWHLADAASQELLGALRRATVGTRVAWAIARNGEADGRDGVVLAPLSDAEVRALVASRLGEPPSAALLARLLPAAHGNPGLADLLLEHWVATHQLEPTAEGWRFTPTGAPAPASGALLWESRLGRASEPALSLARAAAVGFPAGALSAQVLGAGAGLSGDRLAAAVDELTGLGVLVVYAGGAFRLAFAGLVPGVGGGPEVADALLTASLAGVADPTDLPFDRLTGLAHLALAGSDPGLAVALAAEAGRRGLAQASYPEAEALLQGAWERLGDEGRAASGDEERPGADRAIAGKPSREGQAGVRAAVGLPLAEARRQLGRLEDALAGYEAVLALPLDGRARAEALIGMAKCRQMRGEYAPALDALAEARSAAPDRHTQARALVASARIRVFQGDGAAALASAREALATADTPAMRAQALNVAGTLLLQADLAAVQEGMAMLSEALAIAEGMGDRMGAGYVLDNVGNAHLATGALRDAAEAFARSAALYDEAGARAEALAADLNLAIARIELGEDATPLAASVARRADANGRRFLAAAARGAIAQAAWQRGEPHAAAAPLADGLAAAMAIGNKYLESHLRVNAAEAALALGRWAAAKPDLLRARELAAAGAQADMLARLDCLDAEAARQAGEPREANPAAGGLQAALDAGSRWVRHRARQIAAQNALARGRADAALALAREAGELADTWRAPWHRDADALLEARALALRASMPEGQRSEGAHGSKRDDLEAARTLARPLLASPNPYVQAGAALLLATGTPADRRLARATAREVWSRMLAPLDEADRADLLAAHGLDGLPGLLTTAPATGLDAQRWLHALEAVSAAPSEREIGARALAGAVELVGADRGYLLHYEDGRLRRAIAHAMDYLDAGEAFSHSLAEYALLTVEPLYLVDASADPAWSEAASVAALALKTVVCLPLALPDRIMGVIYLDRAALEPQLSPQDLTLLQGLATAAAGAMAREAARVAAVAEGDRQRQAVAFTATLARAASPEAVRDALLAAAQTATRADRAVWVDPDTTPDGLDAATLSWVREHRAPLELALPDGRTVWCLPAGGALLYLDAAGPLAEPAERGLEALRLLVELANGLT